MKYLKVNNWEKFQHYKDRCPPWIKLHRDLLRNYEFQCLQDASKLQLMLIWLLASQLENQVPADEEFIRNQTGIKGKINFKELIDKGFLIDDSEMLASCKQSAMLETETETETETESIRAFESFKILAERNNLSIPAKLTKTRESKLKARLKDCGGLDGWNMALEKLKQSSFCMGKKTSWKADFDFLLQEKTFFKLMEGAYDDAGNNKQNQRQRIANETAELLESVRNGEFNSNPFDIG